MHPSILLGKITNKIIIPISNERCSRVDYTIKVKNNTGKMMK